MLHPSRCASHCWQILLSVNIPPGSPSSPWIMAFLFKLFKLTAAQFAASSFGHFVFICSINIHPLVSDFQRKLSLADNGLAVNSSSFVSKCLQTRGWRGSREMRVAFLHPCLSAGKVAGRHIWAVQPGATAGAWPPAFPTSHRWGPLSPKDTDLL